MLQRSPIAMSPIHPGTVPATSPGVRPDIDVGVIYTYEDGFMPRLLQTMAQSAQGVQSRLLLVDNVSERGCDGWRAHFPNMQVLRNESRLGYAPNLNQILTASTARYILLLNTDMYFEPAEQCLARMVRFMDRNPECGLSTCRLYHPDGSYAYPARQLQSLRVIAARRLGAKRLFARQLDDYLYGRFDHSKSFECEWVSGCFMMVRREAWEQVGGLDCQFRKYFEDVDYCLRMAAAGWKVMFNGDTSCVHCEQRASKNLFTRDARLHLQSYLRFLGKWGFSPRKRVLEQQQELRIGGGVIAGRQEQRSKAA